MSKLFRMFGFALCLVLISILAVAAEPTAEELRSEAEKLFNAGDTIKAMVILKKAVELGDGQSAEIIAEVYKQGTKQIPADAKNAAKWHQKAVELGYVRPVSMGEKNALAAAELYLRAMSFSAKGLRRQLVDFEGYAPAEADYAVENCGADWREQAVRSAERYLAAMSMSKTRLKRQLIDFDDYTQDQATYAVEKVYK